MSQARSFCLPGYLIVEPLRRVQSVAELTPEELADLVDSLAAAERWIRALGPTERVYQLRFGESDGAVHFHVVPRTERLLEGYLKSHSEEPPHSGARIVDWFWFHQNELGYTPSDIDEWVQRAQALVEAEAELPRAWTRMSEAANQYCRWIESLEPSGDAGAELQRAEECRDLLLVILAAGSAMAEVPVGDEEPGDAPEAALAPGFKEVYRRTAAIPLGYYRSDTYDEDRSLEAESSQAIGDFSDDLADIWRDLKTGLHLWGQGHHQEAAWQWRFDFRCHWGIHAVDALRELQISLRA